MNKEDNKVLENKNNDKKFIVIFIFSAVLVLLLTLSLTLAYFILIKNKEKNTISEVNSREDLDNKPLVLENRTTSVSYINYDFQVTNTKIKQIDLIFIPLIEQNFSNLNSFLSISNLDLNYSYNSLKTSKENITYLLFVSLETKDDFNNNNQLKFYPFILDEIKLNEKLNNNSSYGFNISIDYLKGRIPFSLNQTSNLLEENEYILLESNNLQSSIDFSLVNSDSNLVTYTSKNLLNSNPSKPHPGINSLIETHNITSILEVENKYLTPSFLDIVSYQENKSFSYLINFDKVNQMIDFVNKGMIY